MSNVKISFLVALLMILVNLSGFSQNLEIPLLPDNNLKLSRLSPDAQSAASSIKVASASVIRVHITSSTPGIGIQINCPNGQTLNSANIGGLGGTFETYTITPEDGTNGIPPEVSVGTHYIFEFPVQGLGTYNFQFQAPPNLLEEIAVLTELTTDSQLKAKLFTTEKEVVVGKPVVLAVALFDGQTAVNGATVTAQIETPGGNLVNVNLLDSGGIDDTSNDGLYTGFYVPRTSGKYSVVAQITGQNQAGLEFELKDAVDFTAKTPIAKLERIKIEYTAEKCDI